MNAPTFPFIMLRSRARCQIGISSLPCLLQHPITGQTLPALQFQIPRVAEYRSSHNRCIGWCECGCQSSPALFSVRYYHRGKAVPTDDQTGTASADPVTETGTRQHSKLPNTVLELQDGSKHTNVWEPESDVKQVCLISDDGTKITPAENVLVGQDACRELSRREQKLIPRHEIQEEGWKTAPLARIAALMSCRPIAQRGMLLVYKWTLTGLNPETLT
ncbi:hypothetical protein BCR34DRAFT_57046 [Clohesyomyces aquaticus]|uniref:Uncharacterized protein n=1 Tax=Clohesyomyces aquaticus TaxID=1231657 RepID=A0A1Y1Z242_9PLEO|nr:hypothetical protein BCR34DRAFT_57046 [Clohesyomyces aquaticus]